MKTDTLLSYDEYLKLFHDILRKKILSDDQKTRKKGFDSLGNVLSSNYADSDVELQPPTILLNVPELKNAQRLQNNISRNRLITSLLEIIETGELSQHNLKKIEKQLEIFKNDNAVYQRTSMIYEKESSGVNAMIISLRKTMHDLNTKMSSLKSHFAEDKNIISEIIRTNQNLLKVSKDLDNLVQNSLTEQDQFIIDKPAKLLRRPISKNRIKLTS